MKTRFIMTISSILLIFLSIGFTFAQDADKKMEMKEHSEMGDMMKGAHHQMMMAYRQNLVTFTKTLKRLAADSENFDVGSAKMMVAEIKRSAEKMDAVHEDHMSKMDPAMKEKMMPMMEKMNAHKTTVNAQLMKLEESVNAKTIDPKAIEKNAADLAEMMGGHDMDGMKHEEKMKMDMKDHKMKDHKMN